MASSFARQSAPLLLGAFLASLCLPAVAGEPPPRPAPPVPTAIPHQKVELANGLRVILQEDHRAPFVTVYIAYRVGALQESPGKTGLAHLFEHLMFDGSQGTLPLDAHQFLHRLGTVRSNGSTRWDDTVYYETVPAVNLEPAMWMEADRMAHLTGATSSIQLGLARDVVKNERRQRIETVAYSGAEQALAAVLFPSPHPYARYVIGSADDLDTATTDDMRAFYGSWYGPNNATLVLVGDLDPVAALKLVNRHFASIPSRPVPSTKTAPAAPLSKQVRLQIEERIGKAPLLMLAWATPENYSADDAVADVVAHIARVRMHKRLVRLMNAALSVSVSQQSRPLHSLFQMSLTLRSAGQFAKVLSLVDAILDELRQDTTTDEEVERARLSLATTSYWEIQSPLNRAALLASWERYQGTPDWFRQNLARYQRITSADVGRFVREQLPPEKRVVIEAAPVTKETP